MALRLSDGALSLTGCPLPQAMSVMDGFRSTFPGLTSFLTRAIEWCHTTGCVHTLFGRKRYLPHIHALDLKVRQRAERQAVNSIIQVSGGARAVRCDS